MFYKKKGILITSVIVVAMLSLTACTKSGEKKEDAAAPAVEAENLPMPEKLEEEKMPQGEEPEKEETYVVKDNYDLYGDIYEVGEMEFTVTEVYHEESEDGGEVIASAAEGAEDTVAKIKVVYDENTKLIKQVIRNGGASHEEREGTAEDLKKGFTVQMMGSYEGDVFHATEILIVEVIL